MTSFSNAALGLLPVPDGTRGRGLWGAQRICASFFSAPAHNGVGARLGASWGKIRWPLERPLEAGGGTGHALLAAPPLSAKVGCITGSPGTGGSAPWKAPAPPPSGVPSSQPLPPPTSPPGLPEPSPRRFTSYNTPSVSHKPTVLKNPARRSWGSGKGAGIHFVVVNTEACWKVNCQARGGEGIRATVYI